MSGRPAGLSPEDSAQEDLAQEGFAQEGFAKEDVAQEDFAAVESQLGRPPRGVVAVAHRCPCGLPDVVRTTPRLSDGTPFPTTYYLTCPRACAAVSTLEGSGLMRRMSDRLAADPDVAARYTAAHAHYLARRDELGVVPEIAGTSAGGMPGRVKCLHVLVAHALAAGRGVNPLGDEALDAAGAWWARGRCVPAGTTDPAGTAGSAGTAGPARTAGSAATAGTCGVAGHAR